MSNLSRCISAILVSIQLRNLDSSQYHGFKSAWQCVSELVNFTLIAQYRSSTPDTLPYMERYLPTFRQTKDIFLKFRTSKATRSQANRQDGNLRKLMANQDSKVVHSRTSANRRRLANQETVERSDWWADLIRRENHFNFINMHYLSHFAFHLCHFGSIQVSPTEIGKLACKD